MMRRVRARCSDVAVRDILGLYALGRLAPAERARARRHVDRCPPCAADSASLRGITSVLDLLTAEDVAEIAAPEGPGFSARAGGTSAGSSTANSSRAVPGNVRGCLPVMR
jgi:hypothetical protein